jgi:hypothetical protein
MPLIGYVCPTGTPTAGNRNPAAWCFGKCPHPCVTPPLLMAMWSAEHANVHQGAYISASMLSGTGCPRQVVYERHHDFYELPEKRYWAFRGTHAHSIIERGEQAMLQYGWLQELTLSVPFEYDLPAPVFQDGVFTGQYDPKRKLIIQVKGTTDAYNPLRRRLVDFKSMSDSKAAMFAQGDKGGTLCDHLEDRWVWQTNIYGYLLSRTRVPDEVRDRLRAAGFKTTLPEFYPAPKEIVIQGIAMMNAPRTGASIEMKVSKYERRIMEIPPVPILPPEQVEAFIRTQALQWFRWLELGEPAPVVPKAMDWLCRGCAFNGEKIPGERCKPTAERALSKG